LHELDGVRVPELVGCEPAPDSCLEREWRSSTRAAVADHARPRVGPSITQNRVPTGSSARSAAHVATYNGDSNNNSVTSGTTAEPVAITPASPGINTSQQPASATVGSSIADKATVTGGYNPTGTVTFNLYNNPNGTGTPLFTDTKTLSGGMATSKGYTAAATGTDYWVATYNGDINNNGVTSGTAAEPVAINPASPGINTSQEPASATVGSSIADSATVTGGYNPTGTVTFNLHNSATVLLFTDTETLSGGMATSKGYTATAVGIDHWVATYNGDSNNNSVSSGTAAESVSVVYGFGGFMSPLPKSMLVKSGSTIPVKFVLTDSAGNPIAASTAAALASAGKVEATLAGPGISPQTALCAWDGSNLAFQCNIKTPTGLKTGASYTITVAENVGGGFMTAPPVGAAVNPETVFFK
jgi:hypothetical protein